MFGLPQRDIVTVTTTCGPPAAAVRDGQAIVEIIPYVPIATTVRTAVSIFTYCVR